MRVPSLIVATVISAVTALPIGLQAAESRPNVVLIMTDDQGYGDFGCTGNPVIRTPHIDSLYADSARMTDFYVSPVCTPTRACLLTGRYNYRTRALDTYIGRAMMEPQEVTIAEVLRDAGYATGIFGKWHLGDCYPMRAMDQGFEESLVHRGGGIGQPSDPPGGEGKYTDPILFHNGHPEPQKGYCTDVYFDAALKWMKACVERKRPFFAYIPTNAPHDPLHDIPQQIYERYKAIDLSPVVLTRDGGKPTKEELDRVARVFAMITNIDENVGKLVAGLDRLGVAKDTMVIFLTDNGPASRRYVGPFRGTKADVHDGGVRTLLLVRWPGRLKAGHTSDRIAAHIDILPTLLEACGLPVPNGLKLDGRSILPLLEGRQVDWPDRTLFIQTHRGDVPILYHHFMARNQDWKLVNASGFAHEEWAGPPQFELYRIVEDPREEKNLAAERPEVVEQLKKEYEAWFRDVSSTRPDNYAPPRIHIGTTHENPVTLTRQDWRRVDSDKRGYGVRGKWLLHVAKAGSYRMLMRLQPEPAAGQVRLTIGGYEKTAPVTADAKEIVFEGVSLSEGDVELRADVTRGDKAVGPWQVDVSW
ncbi:MAG TPA: arylsulfatase [Phycisphaerae bacterium]|nr:arylsulfatase [Phycisphaerae bacterium]HRR87307.1 arylsulfatase [Phycisphaerae bacterium]